MKFCQCLSLTASEIERKLRNLLHKVHYFTSKYEISFGFPKLETLVWRRCLKRQSRRVGFLVSYRPYRYTLHTGIPLKLCYFSGLPGYPKNCPKYRYTGEKSMYLSIPFKIFLFRWNPYTVHSSFINS